MHTTTSVYQAYSCIAYLIQPSLQNLDEINAALEQYSRPGLVAALKRTAKEIVAVASDQRNTVCTVTVGE